jgi:hypothetical protein
MKYDDYSGLRQWDWQRVDDAVRAIKPGGDPIRGESIDGTCWSVDLGYEGSVLISVRRPE